ncbi:MAG TPA: LptF/LptG family permease, partial [Pedobacter sp.]
NNQMLNLKGLAHKRDSLTKELDSVNHFARLTLGSYYKQNNFAKGYTKVKITPIKIKGTLLSTIPVAKRPSTLQSALDQAKSVAQTTEGRIPDHDDRVKGLIRIRIEYQRKFTLAVSCILLFFIGAPLGAIIRKGGLGLPVVMAIIFFLFYHIITTVAEKSANQGNINPILGIWMAVIVLSPVGAFLTYKATVDSALFDITIYKSFFTNLFRKKKH